MDAKKPRKTAGVRCHCTSDKVQFDVGCHCASEKVQFYVWCHCASEQVQFLMCGVIAH